jgi:hypothetical protein
MPLPSRIGGPEEEKKPGLVVAIGVKKPTLPGKIGGASEEEDDSGEPMDNEKAKDEATKEIMSAIQDRSELRLKSALEAFFLAVDAEPHSEGQHEGEEE